MADAGSSGGAGGEKAARTLRDIVAHVRAVDENVSKRSGRRKRATLAHCLFLNLQANAHNIPFDRLSAGLLATVEEDQLGSLFQVRCFNACDVAEATLTAASGVDVQ